MLENCGFLDVKLRDDAGKKAVAAFPDIARAKCRSVQDTAEILSTQNKATTWCKEMRDAFAASLRQAIAGLDPPETVRGSPLLDPELFLVLLTIMEAGYTEFQGIAKPEYWIDLRGALRIRDDGTGPMLQLLPMREILSAVKAARRNSNAAKFVGSLYEFYGLRLVVERRGWTAAEIMQLLPNLIRSDRWIRYKKFASSPASHTRKR